MKRSFGATAALLATSLLVASGALLSGCGLEGTGYTTLSDNPSEQAPSLVMRLSHPMPPPQEHVLSWIVEEFARSVRERSEGRLKVYVYPNSQLVRLDDRVVDAVATGRVEAAIIPGRDVEETVPAQAIESLPFIFNGWDGFRQVSQDKEFRETIGEEYLQRNLVLIEWNVSGWWGWFASKERPVIRPGDLEGLRMAVNSPEETAMVELAGGIPVPWGEAFAAAQEGTIDGAFVAAGSFVSGQMPQAFKFYPKAEVVAFSNLFLVNKDFWESLPQELQEAVRDASHEFLWEMWLKFSFDTESDEWIAIKDAVSVYELHADDRAAWIELLKPLEADYAGRAGPVGQKLLDIARGDKAMSQVVGGP